MTEITTIPEIKLQWLRGSEKVDFKKASTFLVLGMRGSGKSSLLESIASRYTKIIDIFSSKDSENLAWCKPDSPFKKILFIVGPNVTVTSTWPQIQIDKLKLSDFEPYQVIITTSHFYNSSREHFQALQQITSMLWDQRTYWTEPWCVVIREAANWLYSRLQIVKDSNMAKADFIQCLREARHSGLAVCVDTLRWTSLDKEIRDVSDYVFFKRLGSIGLPKDLHFLYKFVNPLSMMRLRPEVFVTLSSQGNIGYGKFSFPTWHKLEHENILLKLGIDVSRLEGAQTQGFNVSIFEHCKIVENYKQTNSMGMTAAQLNRSKSTISQQVSLHNGNIAECGFCLECHKANNPLEKEKFERKGGKTKLNDQP